VIAQQAQEFGAGVAAGSENPDPHPLGHRTAPERSGRIWTIEPTGPSGLRPAKRLAKLAKTECMEKLGAYGEYA
jgi:hypothetical protein